jgi:DNA-binding CsgD family transcriptional regulator
MLSEDWLGELARNGKLIVVDSHDDTLMHRGTPRHSGRYPWGSGKKPQRSKAFVERVADLRKKGLSDQDIADGFGMSVRDLRKRQAIAKEQYKQANIARAERLKERGLSNVAIASELGVNESTIRTWLSDSYKRAATRYSNVANILKESVDKKKYVDLGEGVERYLGVSEDALGTSVKMLTDNGYEVHTFQVPQISNPSQKTTFKVLCPPGTTWDEARQHQADISMPVEYTVDNGQTIKALHRPKNISSDRVQVKFAEEGGVERDGLIEIRPGVKDLDMGMSRYAQVRIGVDGTHYIKGMAVYSDDLPEGIDIRVNSNKPKSKGKLGALKEQTADPDNPFSASISRQNDWTDDNGKVHEGALNIVNEEGDWSKWKKTLASQMLSKQPVELAKQQLNLSVKEREDELAEISRITNPVIKQRMLIEFADKCDTDACELRGAAMPRQASHVILPDPTLKENHIYAPNYRDGEEVILIRYPHAGSFEIPRLVVDNKHDESRKMMSGDSAKTAIDAVAIHPKVAERLSGADFDGDSVLVIPTVGQKFKVTDPLPGLKNFDSKSYATDDPSKWLKHKDQGGKLMGEVTNLITDMSFQNPEPQELERAIRHSMVAIDAYKHKLDWKQSYIDNNIQGLKEKYQKHDDGSYGGASSLLSRATAETRINERKRYTIDEQTGEKKWIESGRKYYDKKTGELVRATEKVDRMQTVSDAKELASGWNNPMENVYIDYANNMKSLGNKARKESLSVPSYKTSKEAASTYAKEVASLDAKLNKAYKNAPLERKAQAVANSIVNSKLDENPYLKTSDYKEDLKKIKSNALRTARANVGAHRQDFIVTDKEWEAIQAGAVTKTKLEKILTKGNSDRIKELAMPRQTIELTPARISRIQSMFSAGHSQGEIADALGLSPSTVLKYIEEG